MNLSWCSPSSNEGVYFKDLQLSRFLGWASCNTVGSGREEGIRNIDRFDTKVSTQLPNALDRNLAPNSRTHDHVKDKLRVHVRCSIPESFHSTSTSLMLWLWYETSHRLGSVWENFSSYVISRLADWRCDVSRSVTLNSHPWKCFRILRRSINAELFYCKRLFSPSCLDKH